MSLVRCLSITFLLFMAGCLTDYNTSSLRTHRNITGRRPSFLSLQHDALQASIRRDSARTRSNIEATPGFFVNEFERSSQRLSEGGASFIRTLLRDASRSRDNVAAAPAFVISDTARGVANLEQFGIWLSRQTKRDIATSRDTLLNPTWIIQDFETGVSNIEISVQQIIAVLIRDAHQTQQNILQHTPTFIAEDTAKALTNLAMLSAGFVDQTTSDALRTRDTFIGLPAWLAHQTDRDIEALRHTLDLLGQQIIQDYQHTRETCAGLPGVLGQQITASYLRTIENIREFAQGQLRLILAYPGKLSNEAKAFRELLIEDWEMLKHQLRWLGRQAGLTEGPERH